MQTKNQNYTLRGVTFERVGENRIRILQEGSTTPIVEFNLKDWNEVCRNLGFSDYLQDTSHVSGASESGT